MVTEDREPRFSDGGFRVYPEKPTGQCANCRRHFRQGDVAYYHTDSHWKPEESEVPPLFDRGCRDTLAEYQLAKKKADEALLNDLESDTGLYLEG